ncbi:MAG: glycoside hydrolase [Candidatus Scalindua sp.]|jgi:1,4-alpha-glucan branching enzyme|nr:glycoside hydrolase [Candidatus Scalindua sp.]
MKQFALLGINCWVNYIKQIIENKNKNKKPEEKFLETKKVRRITFRLPKVAATDAKSVCIVGDFNNWNTHANPMKKLKDGDYRIELNLELGREYQFRYLIDQLKWENDRSADKYVRSVYGDCDNSVVIVDALD